MPAGRTSGGLLLYRRRPHGLEVLLAHPGGPLWARKDAGAWTIPKGELDPGEEPLAAARREFVEELGVVVPGGPLLDLGSVTQRAGKVVRAWAVEGDLDPAVIVPGTFTMEWPPRSGRHRTYPEVDRVEWFDLATAAVKVNPAQVAFLHRLTAALARD